MSEPLDAVEGQSLARATLEALDRGDSGAWTEFSRTYQERLISVATGFLRRYQSLRRLFDSPEELLNDFLAEKAYPKQHARAMLGPSARKERPLFPRLVVSLGNHCKDLLRSQARSVETTARSEDLLKYIGAPVDESLPTYEEVENLIAHQMEVIRAICPPCRGGPAAPYREALFLRLRLDWAGPFDGVVLSRLAGSSATTLSLSHLEQVTAWNEEEAAAPLDDCGLTLAQAWDRLRPALLASQECLVLAEGVAKALRIPRGRWYQWISRGWERLRQHMGEGYAEVFPLWPTGEGERQ